MFGISRQGYYQRQQRASIRLQELQQVKFAVLQERMSLPRLGTRKLYHQLKEVFQEKRIKIGRDGLFDFLRSEHLLIKPKRSYQKTTNSKHWLHKYPNLYKNRKAVRPDEFWVSDITYIDTIEKTGYLSLVTDVYSRKIVGYHLHESLHTDGVSTALKMAIKGRKTNQRLIHHSDRGLQYCSSQYQKILSKNGILPSMTEEYDCYQNALAERINGILKYEFILFKPKNIDQARKLIREAVHFYNTKRPHLSLDYKTQDQVYKKSLPILLNKDYI